MSIVGYCMGGVLSCIYAATNPNGPLKNLACLTTPIDWHHMGLIRVWEQMWNDDFVKSFRAFERWGNETLPLAGAYVRQMTKELLWDNKLVNGTLVIDGKSADLVNIRIPLLSVCAEHDHLAPYDSVKPLIEKVGSTDKRELLLKGGHVSLIAGPNAVKRTWPQLDAWLAERSV